jgi:hypothetical protein
MAEFEKKAKNYRLRFSKLGVQPRAEDGNRPAVARL